MAAVGSAAVVTGQGSHCHREAEMTAASSRSPWSPQACAALRAASWVFVRFSVAVYQAWGLGTGTEWGRQLGLAPSLLSQGQAVHTHTPTYAPQHAHMHPNMHTHLPTCTHAPQHAHTHRRQRAGFPRTLGLPTDARCGAQPQAASRTRPPDRWRQAGRGSYAPKKKSSV